MKNFYTFQTRLQTICINLRNVAYVEYMSEQTLLTITLTTNRDETSLTYDADDFFSTDDLLALLDQFQMRGLETRDCIEKWRAENLEFRKELERAYDRFTSNVFTDQTTPQAETYDFSTQPETELGF